MVRYYGWYSNKSRGLRQKTIPLELRPRKPGLSPPPPLELPSKNGAISSCGYGMSILCVARFATIPCGSFLSSKTL